MIKNIIAQGIGFSPGSVKYIPTLGFTVGSSTVQHIIRVRGRDDTTIRTQGGDQTTIRVMGDRS